MKRAKVKCPKCKHAFTVQEKKPAPFPFPQKEWDNLWAAVDRLFTKFTVKL